MRYGRAGFMGIIAFSVAASGCLLKDASETWYVGRDGEVTWQVIERDIRSDAENPADRDTEELNYVTAVRAQNHPVARGLAKLGATSVETRLLHASQPFTTITTGTFRSTDELGARLIAMTGASGSSVVARTPSGFRWTLSLADGWPGPGEGQPDDDVSEVVNHLDALSVVLVDGRFTDSRHFDLSSDRRVASITRLESTRDALEGSAMTLMLEWTTGR